MEKKLMPVLFIGHGSPMNAIENNEFTQNFIKIAKEIDRPKAIVCVSAHWFTNGTKITSMDKPKTIHDFYGFPEELYNIDYPAIGDAKLAKEVKGLLDGIKVELDTEWGLDHGAWSVLIHMYPNADIPVIQLSINYNEPASYHYALAKNLLSLREKGVLILGSGNIVHNLNIIDFRHIDTRDYGYEWARKAKDIINKSIINGDFDSLINYKDNRDLDLAIPTPEHFLPLIYILGLKQEDEKIEFFNDILVGGSLSMTSVRIG